MNEEALKADIPAQGEDSSAPIVGYSLGAFIRSDIDAWQKRYYPKAGKRGMALRRCKLILNYCGLRAVIVYRISHCLWRLNVPFLPGIISRHNIMRYGFDVPQSVSIGPGLYVPHPVGTVVMAERIGANVTLVSSVTIGMRSKPLFPVIGDGVFIGAGARVLGNITIGDNVSIGANAVVLTDVPSNMTAVGVPARIKAKTKE